MSERWESLRSRAAALLAERDRRVAETAREWARFAQARGLTRADVECLWEGLTEELLRRCARRRGVPAAILRREVLTTMGSLRARVLDGLARTPEAP